MSSRNPIYEIDFKDISYLKDGNEKQKKTHKIISENHILEILQHYNPIVVGTIPINIDIEESDVDIILQAENPEALNTLLVNHFSQCENFSISIIGDVLVCNFDIEDLPFEIFATNKATEQQNGYLHMLKEYEILQSKGTAFIQQIQELKRNGMKTEPAFCYLLGIEGNPYEEILKYNIQSADVD